MRYSLWTEDHSTSEAVLTEEMDNADEYFKRYTHLKIFCKELEEENVKS